MESVAGRYGARWEGGGQYDVMESVAAKGGFESTSNLTSKSAWGKI